MAEAEYMDDDSRSEMYDDESESQESSSSSECSSSDESQEENQDEEEWTSVDTRRDFTFTDATAMNVGASKTPQDYFKLLFTPTFMNLLVSSINLHSIQILSERLSIRRTDFKPTDVTEVFTLLAVYFLMGYIKVNRMAYYWNDHPLHNLKFENYMSKDRFALLMRALAYKKKSCTNDNGDSRRSWYDAARPIADLFNGTMKTLVVPDKELNIDKSTAHWFNELNFVRRKPERIRMHFLSDGYGIFQRVYLNHPDGKNKGEEIVKFLMKDFLGFGHSLYSCPFYSSVSLAEDLSKQKTYLTGIVNRKKHRNPNFVKKKLKIGGIKSLFNQKGVCVVNIRKTHHSIIALSTEHCASVDLQSKSGSTKIVSAFKKHTSEMFKRNQILSDNSPCDSTKKYNRNIMYLLQVMFINSYLLYNANHTEKMTFSDFRKAILYEIIPLPSERMDSDEDTDASVDSTEHSRDMGEVIHLPAEVSKDKSKRRHCRNCWLERRVRKRTQFYCRQCPQKWGLCLENCFREFHSY